MSQASVVALLLAVAGSQAACAAIPVVPIRQREEPQQASLEPEDPWEGATAPEPEAPLPPRFADSAKRDTFRLGAWGWDADTTGDVTGGTSKARDSGATFPAGYSFEFNRRGAPNGNGTRPVQGLLVEHFQDEGEDLIGGDDVAIRGRLSGAMFVMGLELDPQGAEGAEPEWYRFRLDFLPGLRSGFVRAEVPDGFGGTRSESSSWLEACVGLRAEYRPHPSVGVFARGDFGGGSIAKAESLHGMVGVRWAPVEHASLVAGWQAFRMSSRDVTFFGVSERKVTYSANGPYVGLEVDF